MNRTIKFRSWFKEAEVMVEFFLGEDNITVCDRNDDNWTFNLSDGNDVMQYTGIKDTTTGADVYEGDIVKYQHSKDSTEYIGTIHYREDFASFWLTTNGDTGFALLGAQKVITVLGNIHQHPTLIK